MEKTKTTNGSVAKNTGTKMYGRTVGDRIDEPDTTPPMVGKQYIILL